MAGTRDSTQPTALFNITLEVTAWHLACTTSGLIFSHWLLQVLHSHLTGWIPTASYALVFVIGFLLFVLSVKRLIAAAGASRGADITNRWWLVSTLGAELFGGMALPLATGIGSALQTPEHVAVGWLVAAFVSGVIMTSSFILASSHRSAILRRVLEKERGAKRELQRSNELLIHQLGFAEQVQILQMHANSPMHSRARNS